VLIGTGVVSAFQVGKVPGVLPVLRTDLQLTLFAASWVISMLNVIGALAGVLMGAFADRIGYRRLIITGLTLMLLGCVAGGYTANAGVFLASRFLEGIGFFCTILSAPSLITRIAQPGHLRLILGFWGAYMPTGIAVMLFLSPYVVARVGWRGLWFLNGLICLAVLVLFILETAHLPQIRKTGPQPAGNLAGNVKTVLTAPGPVLLSLCFFCYAGQWMALMSFLPTFFIEQVGMGIEGASLWTALAVLVNIPGNIAGGFLSQKNVPRWAVLSLVFILITAFTVGVYLRATPLGVRLLLCLAYSFVAGLIPGTLLAAVPFHSPGKAYIGAANGLLMQGSNMGTLLMAPALAAAVSFFGGWQGAPWVLVAAGLIGLSTSVAVGWLEKSPGVGSGRAGNLKE
jgi:MFS family permease